MCHCCNTGMEQTPNKILSMQKSLTINMYSSCLSEVSLMLHLNQLQDIYLYVDLFGVHSTPVLPQWHVKDPGHSAKSAGGRLPQNMQHAFDPTKSEWADYAAVLA